MDVLCKQSNRLIEATHYRALRARLNNFPLTCEDLLKLTNSISIHNKNLCLLVIEVYKSLYKLNPEFVQNIFCINSTTYSLRAVTILTIPQCKSTYGLNTFNFRATLAWNHLPKGLKDITSLNAFKTGLKNRENLL